MTINDIQPGQHFTVQNANTIWHLDESEEARLKLDTYCDKERRIACVNDKGVRRYYYRNMVAHVTNKIAFIKADNTMKSFIWLTKNAMLMSNAKDILDARTYLTGHVGTEDMRVVEEEPDYVIETNEPGPHILIPWKANLIEPYGLLPTDNDDIKTSKEIDDINRAKRDEVFGPKTH